jgi:hypothetical protein
MVVKFPVSPSARARLRRRTNPSPAAVRKPRQRSEREVEWFRTFGPRLRATRLALGLTEAEAAAVARHLAPARSGAAGPPMALRALFVRDGV